MLYLKLHSSYCSVLVSNTSSSSDLVIMFDEIKGGGVQGANPWLSRGVWEADSPPTLNDRKLMIFGQ